jgi:hypothetical protein
MWLYTFWIDYKNQKAIQVKLMELQEVERGASNQVADDDEP